MDGTEFDYTYTHNTYQEQIIRCDLTGPIETQPSTSDAGTQMYVETVDPISQNVTDEAYSIEYGYTSDWLNGNIDYSDSYDYTNDISGQSKDHGDYDSLFKKNNYLDFNDYDGYVTCYGRRSSSGSTDDGSW